MGTATVQGAGFEVEETNDIFALDADLTGYDLIALNWNNRWCRRLTSPRRRAS